jgi:hypothetical protein
MCWTDLLSRSAIFMALLISFRIVRCWSLELMFVYLFHGLLLVEFMTVSPA